MDQGLAEKGPENTSDWVARHRRGGMGKPPGVQHGGENFRPVHDRTAKKKGIGTYPSQKTLKGGEPGPAGRPD